MVFKEIQLPSKKHILTCSYKHSFVQDNYHTYTYMNQSLYKVSNSIITNDGIIKEYSIYFNTNTPEKELIHYGMALTKRENWLFMEDL